VDDFYTPGQWADMSPEEHMDALRDVMASMQRGNAYALPTFNHDLAVYRKDMAGMGPASPETQAARSAYLGPIFAAWDQMTTEPAQTSITRPVESYDVPYGGRANINENFALPDAGALADYNREAGGSPVQGLFGQAPAQAPRSGANRRRGR
jgi:hypothetical protein